MALTQSRREPKQHIGRMVQHVRFGHDLVVNMLASARVCGTSPLGPSIQVHDGFLSRRFLSRERSLGGESTATGSTATGSNNLRAAEVTGGAGQNPNGVRDDASSQESD